MLSVCSLDSFVSVLRGAGSLLVVYLGESGGETEGEGAARNIVMVIGKKASP